MTTLRKILESIIYIPQKKSVTIRRQTFRTVNPPNTLSENEWKEEFNIGRTYSKYQPLMTCAIKEHDMIKEQAIKEAQKSYSETI